MEKKTSLVAVVSNEDSAYSYENRLCRPSENYPEYLLKDISEEKNNIYGMVRESFRLLGLDADNYGKACWNPLGEVIHPGDTVLIKPNLVMHKNANVFDGTDCLYTQPEVVAPVIDYALIALQGEGKIIIGDAPMQECDFDYLLKYSGYQDLVKYYQNKKFPVSIVDFRGLHSTVKDGIRYSIENKNAKGLVIALDDDSEFAGITDEKVAKMRITNYDPRILQKHHNVFRHEYYISNYVLEANVIINMPKPKTHRKAGATISLKNFVGVNTRKEFLPHHTMGSIKEGGDEYLEKNLAQRFRSRLRDKRNIAQAEGNYLEAKIYRRLIGFVDKILRVQRTRYSEGSWYGNDTISRTIIDLNKVIKYADNTGKMKNEPQRKMLIVADMIVSGEKEGPVAPSAKSVGIIASGINQVCFDEAISMIMGLDYKKIPTIVRARQSQKKYPLVDKNEFPLIISNDSRYNYKKLGEISRIESLQFVPTSGWTNHIETE